MRTAKPTSSFGWVEAFAQPNIDGHNSSHVDELVEVGLLCTLRGFVPQGENLNSLNELERFGTIADDTVGDGPDDFSGQMLARVGRQKTSRACGQDAGVQNGLLLHHIHGSGTFWKDDSGHVRRQLRYIVAKDGDSCIWGNQRIHPREELLW